MFTTPGTVDPGEPDDRDTATAASAGSSARRLTPPRPPTPSWVSVRGARPAAVRPTSYRRGGRSVSPSLSRCRGASTARHGGRVRRPWLAGEAPVDGGG